MFYLQKKYTLKYATFVSAALDESHSNYVRTTTYSYLHYNALARFHLSVFSLGVGPYFSYGLSGSYSDSSSSKTESKTEINDLEGHQLDYGAVASSRVFLWKGRSSGVSTDIRLIYGLKDLDNTSGKQQTQLIEVLVGYQF